LGVDTVAEKAHDGGMDTDKSTTKTDSVIASMIAWLDQHAAGLVTDDDVISTWLDCQARSSVAMVTAAEAAWKTVSRIAEAGHLA
jgi:predicted transcriptional regulator